MMDFRSDQDREAESLRAAAAARPRGGITEVDAHVLLSHLDPAIVARRLRLAERRGRMFRASRLTIDRDGTVGQEWRYFATGGPAR